MTRQDLRERVYRELRRDLMSGNISAAVRLGEERLAESYGVSRTPVREALARLQADGLVTRDDDGLHAYRPRLTDLPDLYELRRTLEVRGIVRSTPTSYDLGALREERDLWRELRADPPKTTDEMIALDESFHVTLLTASGNSALTDALCAANAKVRPVRMLGGLDAQSMISTIDEHLAVIDAVLAEDYPRASELLAAHIDRSRDRIVQRAETARSMADAVRP